MSEVISQIADTVLPDSVLNAADFENIARDFQENFRRLGDFQRIREAHSNRGGWKKIWDALTFDDTLKNAQLDATEVQAAFSKSIGQLIVLTVLQSKKLKEQQGIIQKQQVQISTTQENIRIQQEKLAEQTQNLAVQNLEIHQLATQSIEFKEKVFIDIEKLLTVASGVNSIREEVISKLEIAVATVVNRSRELELSFTKLFEESKKTLGDANVAIRRSESRIAEINVNLEGMMADLNQRLASESRNARSRDNELARKIVDNHHEASSFAQHHSKLAESLDERLKGQIALSAQNFANIQRDVLTLRGRLALVQMLSVLLVLIVVVLGCTLYFRMK